MPISEAELEELRSRLDKLEREKIHAIQRMEEQLLANMLLRKENDQLRSELADLKKAG